MRFGVSCSLSLLSKTLPLVSHSVKMMEIIRLFTYLLTIISVTVTWILAAVFLAKTESTLNGSVPSHCILSNRPNRLLTASQLARTSSYYNGNVIILTAGAMSMLVLPLLCVFKLSSHTLVVQAERSHPYRMFLGAGKRRKDFAGVTIAECIVSQPDDLGFRSLTFVPSRLFSSFGDCSSLQRQSSVRNIVASSPGTTTVTSSPTVHSVVRLSAGLGSGSLPPFSSYTPSNHTDVLLSSFILLTILFVVTLVHGMFDYEGRQAKKDGLVPMDSNAPLDPNAVNNGGNINVEKGGSSVPLAPPVPIVKD